MKLIHGDCLEEMPRLQEASIDAVVTDPPYGLSFMGKDWDHGVPGVPFWEQALRVAKPGAHLLAFGGTRTFHRLTCAIEDAGWVMRDCLMWLYGSGFPHSLDVSKAIDKAAGAERDKLPIGSPVNRMIPGADQNSTGSWIKDNGREYQPVTEIPATDAAKQWDGWGTTLKPAWEPIIMARKPLDGTVVQNVLKYGTGALNIDACRIGTEERYSSAATAKKDTFNHSPGSGTAYKGKPVQGRWPANLIHDGSDEVVDLFPQTKSGEMKAGTRRAAQDQPGSVCYGTYGGPATNTDTYADSGSAARFFYTAKASGTDRGNLPAEGMPLFGESMPEFRNDHPTVKPLDLMPYLLRLVVPPGGIVLDPFMGSGSTLVAARMHGCRAIGIEIDAHYCQIAARRLGEDRPAALK